MIETVIAKKYAKSFLNVTGGKASPIKKYQKTFDAILELFKIKDSHTVLSSYSMPRALKEELLSLALDLGKAPVELREFVSFLLEQGRERFLPEIISCYEKLLQESQGVVAATALSSQALSSEESKLISQELERLLKKKVSLTSVVDKSILGGVKIQVGNSVIDCSLNHKLDLLTAQVAS